MKKILLLIALIVSGLAGAATVPFSIEWTFVNVETGYDHENRIEVFVDGKNVGTSQSTKETSLGKFSVDVETGLHDIKIVNYVLYENRWEEHTVANNYSIDAIYETSRTFKSTGATVSLTWDLDADVKVNWIEKSNSAKKDPKTAGEIPMTITWKYVNVVEGYDHDARLKVYADGKLIATSPASKGSKGGTFKVKIPKGTYTLLAMTESYFEGDWEEHTKDNNYSVDGFAELSDTFKKAVKLTMVFDIDTEESDITWKK